MMISQGHSRQKIVICIKRNAMIDKKRNKFDINLTEENNKMVTTMNTAI